MASVPLVRRVGVAAAVLALGACTGVSTAPSPTAPAPTVAASAAASTTASPAPATPSRSIVVVAVNPIPSRFRYAVISWDVTRVWVVDLQARVTPRLVIRLEPASGGELSSSSSGEVIVLSAPGAHGHSAVHVVHPTTGRHTVVHDDVGAQVGAGPIVTPAGDRYAFAKQIAGAHVAGGTADLGLWIGSTDGSATRRVIAGGASAPATPLAWSPDGRSLAFARATEIFVLGPDGSEQRAGAGVGASWLSNTTLLIARGAAAPSGIDRYELGTGAIRDELRTTGRVVAVHADPIGRRYAYIERTGTEDLLTSGTVWLRDTTGGAARGLGARPIADIEWSSDGEALTGILGGDDSITGVADLLGGAGAGLCRRSDSLPQASPGGCI